MRKLSTQEIRYRKVISIIKGLKFDADKIRIVDLGCGSGEFIRRLYEELGSRFLEVYGIDISQKALNNLPKYVKPILFDLNNEGLPLPDDHFNLILALEVIEHLIITDSLISETYRITKPGGYFICSTPNLASWINRIRILMGVTPLFYDCSQKFILDGLVKKGPHLLPFVRDKKDLGHVRLYTLRGLVNHLKAYGFEVIKVEGYPITCWFESKRRLLNIFHEIYNIANWLFSLIPSLASGIIVVARKPEKDDEKSRILEKISMDMHRSNARP